MKKNVLSRLTMVIFVSAIGYSQTTRVDLPTEYVRNTTVGNNALPENVQGSPYFTEGFVAGKVFTGQDEPYNAMLRYNGYNDQIEMKDMDNTTALLKRDHISANFGGRTYGIRKFDSGGETKQGYFVVLNQGKAQLLLRQVKEFVEGKKATSSYGGELPPKFVDRITYYITIDDNPALMTKLKKKDILKLFANNKEIAEYVNNEGLKLKSEEEVLQVLNYYNNSL